MCYLFHVAAVYVLVGEIMSNHSYNFFFFHREEALRAFFFSFFFLSLFLAFQMSHFRWNGFYGSACMPIRNPQLQPRHNHAALAPACVPLSARVCLPLPTPATGQRRRLPNICSSVSFWKDRDKHLLALLLFPPFAGKRDGCSTVSHQNHRSNIVWYHCASACKRKFNNQWPSYFNCSQTQSGEGGEGRPNNTVLFLHQHLMP